MYVSCKFIGQDEGNILLWHMAQRVTLFLLSPSHLEPPWEKHCQPRGSRGWQCLFRRVTIWYITLSTICYLIYYTECFHFLVCNDVFFFILMFHKINYHLWRDCLGRYGLCDLFSHHVDSYMVVRFMWISYVVVQRIVVIVW
jgi:hypothetical protein